MLLSCTGPGLAEIGQADGSCSPALLLWSAPEQNAYWGLRYISLWEKTQTASQPVKCASSAIVGCKDYLPTSFYAAPATSLPKGKLTVSGTLKCPLETGEPQGHKHRRQEQHFKET